MKSEFPSSTAPSRQARTLRSTTVDDEYEISIWLPPSYNASQQQYPALYLLDSPYTFDLAVTIVSSQISEGMVPEMVVVGIGKHVESHDEWRPIRERDYSPVPLPSQPISGHAATFLDFIDTELIPLVEENFRVDPDNRTLWGHSLGGAFVLFALFSKLGLFNRCIATSPALVLEGATLLDYETGLPMDAHFSETRLFVSVGSLDHEFGPHVDTFVKMMHDRAYPALDFRTTLLEQFGHTEALQAGFIQGLLAVFS